MAGLPPGVVRAVNAPSSRRVFERINAPIVVSPPVAALLKEPTWSVKSLLPKQEDHESAATVTPKELRHLLRLSALPPPKNNQEESDMLKTLQSQIHFVKEIQKVDTTDVEPLQAIRDETVEGIEEQTITPEDLKPYLDAEEVVGRNGRIRRRPIDDLASREAEDWEPFTMSPGKTIGRHFFVRRESKTAASNTPSPAPSGDASRLKHESFRA